MAVVDLYNYNVSEDPLYINRINSPDHLKEHDFKLSNIDIINILNCIYESQTSEVNTSSKHILAKLSNKIVSQQRRN